MFSDIYANLTSPAFVPPTYPDFVNPEICIVLERANRGESLSKRYLEGSFENKILTQCLRSAGFSLQQAHITAVIKEVGMEVHPYITPPRTRRQSPQWSERGNAYAMALNKEIERSTARFIIAVGNVPLVALTGRWGMYKWRGSAIQSIHHKDKVVFSILSPENIAAGSTEDTFLITQDLKKAYRFFKNGMTVQTRKLLTRPTYAQVCTFLTMCYQRGMEGTPISFDIEVKNLELNCISFSFSPDMALSIPFVDSDGDTFAPPVEAAIMRMIAKILSSRQIRKQGQNLVFDTHFLLRKYGIRTYNIDDSMVAQHTFMPQLPKGLDMVTSLWTDVPYYKDDGKEWIRGGGTYAKLWDYNCLDSIVVQEAMPKLLKNLALTDNLPAYERQLSIIEPCVYMMERGIRVNLERLRYERGMMEAEVAIAKHKLASITNNLNVNSPKQMQDYFFGKLGIPPIKNKHHKVSADAEAMKRIARAGERGAEEASLILEIKKKEKLISTYLTDTKFDTDERIRCSYNPVGTTYSRLSSSKSLFGTGMNMQNWPHTMLKYLEPDEGYVLYTMDLSQAENRIVAYVGRIEKMIQAFETGQDVHRLTASLIFNKPPEDISDEPGSCSLGNGDSTERQWGKKANHGLNYDFGFKSFALLYDMSFKDAKFIVDSYHRAYPELRKNFHGYVKKSLRDNRTVTNLMGRKTIFVSALEDSTFKAAYSCIPQGTVGDVINERGMAYIYHTPMFAPVEILQQVHDSISFQIPLTVPWEGHASILQRIKENLEKPLTTHYGRSFVIPVDTVMGLSFMKEEGIELKSKKWPATLPELASTLRQSYQKLLEQRNAGA